MREEAGLTQATLAQQAGIEQSTISRLESGTRMPEVASLALLAQTLDVPIGRLFDDDESSTKQRPAIRRLVHILSKRSDADAKAVLEIVRLIFAIRR